jgi:hypothetical protein
MYHVLSYLLIALTLAACGAREEMNPPETVTLAASDPLGAQPPPPPKSIRDDPACRLFCWPLSPERARQILEGTAMFADSAIYVGGEPSPQVAAFNILLDQPQAEILFSDLSQSSNPVSQLYALSGLQALESSQAEAVADRLRRTEAIVTTQSGCIRGRDSVRDVVDMIERSNIGTIFRESRDGTYTYFARLASGTFKGRGVCGRLGREPCTATGRIQ